MAEHSVALVQWLWTGDALLVAPIQRAETLAQRSQIAIQRPWRVFQMPWRDLQGVWRVLQAASEGVWVHVEKGQ